MVPPTALAQMSPTLPQAGMRVHFLRPQFPIQQEIDLREKRFFKDRSSREEGKKNSPAQVFGMQQHIISKAAKINIILLIITMVVVVRITFCGNVPLFCYYREPMNKFC